MKSELFVDVIFEARCWIRRRMSWSLLRR